MINVLGALQGVTLMAKIPFEEMARNIVKLALVCSEHVLTTLTPSFNLSKVMRDGMEEMLPDDIHLLVRDKLHISMTKVWDRSNLAVNSFNSKAELLDALQASSFVPFMCGWLPPRFKGSLVLDGFYTDNLPVFDSNTISVSPFAGDASICPKDDRIFSFLKIKMPHGNHSLKKYINVYEICFRFEKCDKFYDSVFWKYEASVLRCGASQRGLDGGTLLGGLPGCTQVPQAEWPHTMYRLQDRDEKGGLSWLQAGRGAG